MVPAHRFGTLVTGERQPPAGSGGFAQAKVFQEPERKVVTVEVEMLDDERDRALELIREREWSVGEGLHSIFSRGLVAVEHADERQQYQGKRLIDMKTPEERDAFLLARLNELESKYAVMKFTAFGALRENQMLTMNVTGLSIEYQALSTTNTYLRGREDELRARIGELEAQVRPAPIDARSRWRKVWDALYEALR